MSVTDHGVMTCQTSLASAQAAPSLWQILTVWRTRRQLKALDAAQLCDIGISAKAARSEARRPIWDVPTTWRN